VNRLRPVTQTSALVLRTGERSFPPIKFLTVLVLGHPWMDAYACGAKVSALFMTYGVRVRLRAERGSLHPSPSAVLLTVAGSMNELLALPGTHGSAQGQISSQSAVKTCFDVVDPNQHSQGYTFALLRLRCECALFGRSISLLRTAGPFTFAPALYLV